MSDATGQEAVTPLWTDEEIQEAILSVSQYISSQSALMLHSTAADDIVKACRDDCLSERSNMAAQLADNLYAAIENLSAASLALADDLSVAKRRIAELEAERDALAGWEPIEDDIYNTDGPEVIFVKKELLSIIGEHYIYLPKHIRLCRRVPASEG